MRNHSPLFLICLLLFMAGPVKADLDNELKGMFTDMINVTPGGSYQTQRRGVITGGSISMRNKVVNPNLISFVPPDIKGGCGGIDLFGGSFSFINGAQFTQLMRSIAQAAVGYAFQLAIEGMCPTCAQVIAKLQKDVGFINSLMKNSCDASKLAVNATGLKSWHDERMNESASLNAKSGFMEDFFASKEGSESPAKTVIVNGKANEITGNIVYEALDTANATSWFVNGDDQLKMVLMSLTGTLITNKKDDNSDVKYDFRPPLVKVRDFIEGGSIEIYQCESSECLLPEGSNKQIITFKGLRTRVREMVLGNGICGTCTGGLLRKMANREGGDAFTGDEQKFIDATSPGAYGLLRRLSTEMQSAALVADRMVDILATELTHRIVDEMFDTVRNSVTATGRPLDSSMLDVMRDTRQQINEERRVTGEFIAGIATLIDLQQNIVQTLRTPAFHKTQ
jgi:conjugative transfer pilus assembly protein TraH